MEINNEVEIRKNIYIGNAEGKKAIIIINYVFDEIDKHHISIKKILVNHQLSTLIKIKSNDAIIPLKSLFKNIFDLQEIQKILNILSSKSLMQFTKLMSDYAKALFIYKFGGEKINGNLNYDIILNKKMLKIKNYFHSKDVVSIKNNKISETIQIIGVDLKINSNGQSILELANQISDKIFANKLINKYADTDLENIKLLHGDFHILQPTKINFGEEVKDASIEFFIEKIKGDIYE